MFKNKYIIAILSFYIFWIGVLPLILTKTVEVVCKNYSHNSNYEIKINKPSVRLSFLPTLTFKIDELQILSKNNSADISLENLKINLRILPILSGKLHFNSISAGKFLANVNLKERFVLDKDFFLKAEALPFEINSLQVENYETKFYRPDIKLPVVYKGENFDFKRKNRFVSFKNKSLFVLGEKTSKMDIDLFLPKDNDLDKTVFNINFSDFDIAPLKIYLKHYLPEDLVELKGDINTYANILSTFFLKI